MQSNANAAKIRRIADALDPSHRVGNARGRSPRAEQVQLLPDPSELFAHNGVREASYSANGYAIAGHGSYTEPVAETFPLRGNYQSGGGNLQDMAGSSLGTSSVRDRRNMALGVASGFAVVWFLVKWVAENKLDAFGWGGAFALIADYWYPWTPKVAKLMTFIL